MQTCRLLFSYLVLSSLFVVLERPAEAASSGLRAKKETRQQSGTLTPSALASSFPLPPSPCPSSFFFLSLLSDFEPTSDQDGARNVGKDKTEGGRIDRETERTAKQTRARKLASLLSLSSSLPLLPIAYFLFLREFAVSLNNERPNREKETNNFTAVVLNLSRSRNDKLPLDVAPFASSV